MAEKDVIRTDRAPGPFQGAPYNQAIRVGEKGSGHDVYSASFPLLGIGRDLAMP